MTRFDLTPPEKYALQWLSHGLDHKGTAEMMGIGIETVHSHVALARLKLGAKNTAHAVALAFRRGVIS